MPRIVKMANGSKNKFYTTPEVVKLLGLSGTNMVRYYIEKGALKSVVWGGRHYVTAESVAEIQKSFGQEAKKEDKDKNSLKEIRTQKMCDVAMICQKMANDFKGSAFEDFGTGGFEAEITALKEALALIRELKRFAREIEKNDNER